jgi:flagellar basal-body rod modification protein FlgD
VIATSPLDTNPAQVASASASADASAALSSDFDTFLQLLTAQIRHQDPLEPVDNTEFVAQLATFSNVEQAIRSNELLEGISDRLDAQDMAAAGSWIGLEVRHAGPVSSDHPTTLHTEIPAVADRAELVVTDDRGEEVLRHPIDANATRINWPLPTAPLPSGQYAVTVEAASGERALTPTPVSHYAGVREVVPGATGLDLVLETGVRTGAASLEAVRRADDAAAAS